ncbi:chromosomal replication initiator protein DnaA [Mycoplasmopsis felifaucium]|uniref:chromosomal replication initiator protein DnaA n=1 Tax=Mycoplasmopsis felifaucium TaxID=35768 RepID=UPI00048407FA|nr:chromosomal replication initiator protein DnaA [Mycoplasmopsis felifaucium]
MSINVKNEKEILMQSYTQTFLNILVSEINDPLMFKSFFNNLKIVNVEGSHVTIGTTVKLTSISAVASVYENSINKALEETFEHPCTYGFEDMTTINSNKKKKEVSLIKSELFNSDINKNLTFENYVECDFNKEAIRVANYIIEGGREYVPIFIFGKSGLGKTHLMHAISNKLIEEGSKVKYINANSFSRDISVFLQENDQVKLKKIRDEFDESDVVLFDDFQSYGIGNKKATINLIFNILDYRISSKKLTIVCSDRPIYSLNNMFDQRLITRLSIGLQLEIKEPIQADLLKILNFMIDKNNLSPELWEKDAKQYIVRNYANSIRSLIGAVNRLKFYNTDIIKTNSKYTLTVVNSILKDIQQVKEKITPDMVIEYIAKYYKVSKKDILGKTRKKDVVLARHIAMWLIRSLIDVSLEQIGKIFGNRDHSTVTNAINKINKESDQGDSSLKRTISQISDELYKNK